MCIPQTIDIFGTGIVAGAFVDASRSMLGSRPNGLYLLDPEDPMSKPAIDQELDGLPSDGADLLPLPASIAAVALCRTSVSWPLDALGCALSVATIGITVAVNAPLNRRFARWSPEALPHDWERDVGRWNVAHSIRMTSALAAFTCAILARS